MEMFFPGHNESSLKSKAVKDKGQRQLKENHMEFPPLIPLVYAHTAENEFRNNSAQLLHSPDKNTVNRDIVTSSHPANKQ